MPSRVLISKSEWLALGGGGLDSDLASSSALSESDAENNDSDAANENTAPAATTSKATSSNSVPARNRGDANADNTDHRANENAAADTEIYIPPPAAPVAATKKRKRSKNKKPKDPNKPKHPITAFLYFCDEMRPHLRARGISASGPKMGEMWRSATAVERKKYDDRAATDKARYWREMAVYNAGGAAVTPPVPPGISSISH